MSITPVPHQWKKRNPCLDSYQATVGFDFCVMKLIFSTEREGDNTTIAVLLVNTGKTFPSIGQWTMTGASQNSSANFTVSPDS